MHKRRIGLPIIILVGGEYTGTGIPISPTESAEIRRRILTKAAETFGGGTITTTQGAWTSDRGMVRKERGFQILVYTYPLNTLVDEFIEFVLAVSRQESILVDEQSQGAGSMVSAEKIPARPVDPLDDAGTEHG